MDREFKKWLNVPVVVIPTESQDGAGDIIPGQERSLKCYPVGGKKMVINRDGQSVLSTETLILDGDPQIGYFDKIVYTDMTFTILQIKPYLTETGVVDFTEVMI
jgi:hypothetical protein